MKIACMHQPPSILFLVGAMSLLLSGCYDALIELEGEQYYCECTYNQEIELGMDSDGFPCTISCGIEPLGGCNAIDSIPPLTTVTDPPIIQTPCAEVVFPDPGVPCSAACEARRNPFVECSTNVVSAIYEGSGTCWHGGSTEDDYVAPNIPVDAVRNGQLVPGMSTLNVTVTGIGSGVPVPLDNGTITVQGGACPVGTVNCPFAITDMEVNAVAPVNFGGGWTADTLQLDNNLAMIVESTGTYTARVDNTGAAPDTWVAETDTGLMPACSGATFPFRVNAELTNVVGPSFSATAATLSFPWSDCTGGSDDGSLGETMPTGAIDLRPGTGAKFVTIVGSVDALVNVAQPGDPPDLREAQLTLDLRFNFFSGAAFVDAAFSDGDPDYVVVDGRGTTDILGSPGPLEYEWRARLTEHPLTDTNPVAILGYGAYTSVPRGIWDRHFASSPSSYLCLFVRDVDGHRDEQCIKVDPNAQPVPPQAPLPGCGDTVVGPSGGLLFAQLVDPEVLEMLNGLEHATVFLPTAEALGPDVVEYLTTTATEQERATFILNHVYASAALDADEVAASLPEESTAASGNTITVNPAALSQDILLPDVDCGSGDTSRVHVVQTTLGPPLF